MNFEPEYVIMYFLYHVFSHMHFYVDIKESLSQHVLE